MNQWLQLDERFLYAYAALFGIACGVASNHGVLAGSWANLLFWGIVGILLGLFAQNKYAILIAGAIYGVFLVTTFLYAGYHGSAESIPGFIGLSFVFAIVGAACGIVCTYLGYMLRKTLLRNS